MRTADEKSERQQALKEKNEEQWDPEFLTLADCARLMKCSRGTARRLTRLGALQLRLIGAPAARLGTSLCVGRFGIRHKRRRGDIRLRCCVSLATSGSRLCFCLRLFFGSGFGFAIFLVFFRHSRAFGGKFTSIAALGARRHRLIEHVDEMPPVG